MEVSDIGLTGFLTSMSRYMLAINHLKHLCISTRFITALVMSGEQNT
jgi:hypothetical protein